MQTPFISSNLILYQNGFELVLGLQLVLQRLYLIGLAKNSKGLRFRKPYGFKLIPSLGKITLKY